MQLRIIEKYALKIEIYTRIENAIKDISKAVYRYKSYIL